MYTKTMLLYLKILYQYLLSAYADRLETQFTVTIDTSRVVHTLDDRFLSVSLSPRLLGNASIHTLFATKRFSSLLDGLAPCYLRAGGTAGESVTFNSSSVDIPPTLPPMYYEEEIPTKFRPVTMYGNHWIFLNDVAQKNGAFFLFQINDMKRSAGTWDDSNFRELLNFTVGKSFAANLGFEFGNEPNAYRKTFNQTISVQTHAREFLRAAAILKKAPYSQAFVNNVMVTPDISGADKNRNLKYLHDFLQVAGDSVDKITFHQYYLKAKAGNLGIANFTDPAVLDSLIEQIQQVKAVAKDAGQGHKEVWLGETGSASGGGVPGLSNRFVAGFMWLDKLGIAAEYGIDVVIRQTLYTYDNHYALIYDDLEPYPDYWLSHIYKTLVGTRVYETQVNQSGGKLRCYTSSLAESQQSTHQQYEHEVEINLNAPFQPSKLQAYVLESHGEEGLRSRYVQLNGEKLMMTSDDTLPELKPISLDPSQPIKMPQSSMAFYTIHAPRTFYTEYSVM